MPPFMLGCDIITCIDLGVANSHYLLNCNHFTVQVIPLSQRSGLLEWCEGTISIGDYLVGATTAPNDGAHSRYNPNDWTNGECKRKMMEVT